MKGSSSAGIRIGFLLLLVLASPTFSFYPYFHKANTLQPLKGAGFSRGQAWMLAYFNIEIDIGTEVPMFLCRNVLRWPTKNKVCITCFGGGDPCHPNACFDDWVNCALPFHSPGARPARKFSKVIQEWRLIGSHGPLHLVPGERCYDWLVRFGHMLHGVHDFYAHSNWVEVFHEDLGFDFHQIPTWTTFHKSQRGHQLNLLLLHHAGGDRAKAIDLFKLLDSNLKVEKHDIYNKDSNQLDDSCYENGSGKYHEDPHGHTVLDFQRAASFLAGIETYQLGMQMRLNIVNDPRYGSATWMWLFNCVEEMAAYDGISVDEELEIYQEAIARVKTYGGTYGVWR